MYYYNYKVHNYFVLVILIFSSNMFAKSAIFNSKLPLSTVFYDNFEQDIQVKFSKTKDIKFFKLHVTHANEIDNIIKGFVKNHINHPLIKVRAINQISTFYLNNNDVKTKTYKLYVQDVPLCDNEIKVHQLSNNPTVPIVLGHFPKINSNYIPNLDLWPNYNITYQNIIDFLYDKELYDSKINFIQKKPCLYVKDQEIYPAWKIIVEIFNLPYMLIANEADVFVFHKQYFGVNGIAKIYNTGPGDSTLKDFVLYDLVGDGSLTNSYFFTHNNAGLRANSSSHQFIYSPTDYRFAEVAIFTNANRHYEFFKSLGHQWDHTIGKLKLVAHALVEGNTNNALYVPAYGTNPPTIYIGDGDGVILQNLGLDRDVVSHELGHHIIYQNLKEVDGETLILHEGLADYFLYAATNNSCLGESVCPYGSPVQCEIEAHCLRTADNNYILNINTKFEPHFKSQFLSGMLWSLRTDIGAEIVDKLVFKALSFLLMNSGYRDFIISMLMADSELFNGSYCSKIIDVSAKRGLSQYIGDLSCDKPIPVLTGVVLSDQKVDNNQSSSSSKKKKYIFCGVLSNDRSFNSNIFGLLIFILIPIFLILRFFITKKLSK